MSAHSHHHASLEDPGLLHAPRLEKACLVLIGIGVLGLIWALLSDLSGERLWGSLLQGMLIPLFIGIAGMFFIAVHNIVGAQWLTPYRRLIEGLSAGLPIGIVTALLIALVGSAWLYDYAYLSHPFFGGNSTAAHQQLFHIHGGSKSTYMQWWRLVLMTAVIAGLWWFLRNKLVAASLRQDVTGELLQRRNFRLSVAYIFAFGFGLTFFTWDLILSLHVNWFSTMWGAYCFASAVQAFLCALVLVSMWLRRGPLQQYLPRHIVHDLGTWMVAWSCFCAYIGFSQYMLIYYANLDEETYWYVMRTQNGYGLQYFIEMLLRWPLPFLGLMSQRVRTNPRWLVTISIAVLAGNWMDWSWLIQPAFSPDEYRSPFFSPEFLVGAGFAGGLLLAACRFWKRHGLVPRKDPHLEAAVHGEHLH